MLGKLALCLALGIMPLQDPPTGTIQGVVYSDATGEPLSNARVDLRLAHTVLWTMTDSIGAYLLKDVPVGRWKLRVSHLSHQPHEAEVHVVAATVTLHFSLEMRPIPLPPVRATGAGGVVAGDSVEHADSLPPANLTAAMVRAMEVTPGIAEMGLAAGSHRGAPGQEPADPADVFYVRGSATDLKLVLLDGAPVYSPFHVGGLIPAFSDDLLGRADLFLGGAPARYDGGLSYILDLETRPGRGDRLRYRGGLDMMGGRLGLEGPLGSRAVLLADARAVHGAAVGRFMDGGFPYAYADGLLRLDARVGDDGLLRATGFWNQEAVELGGGESGGQSRPEWGNLAFSLRYSNEIAGCPTEMTGAYSRFESQVPFTGARPYVVEATMERGRLSLERKHRARLAAIQYGAGYELVSMGYRTRTPTHDLDSPVDAMRSVAADVVGAHVDAYLQPGERFSLRGGLRGDYFRSHGSVRVAPRLAATWLFRPDAAVTLAAGRYHQYMRVADRLMFPALGELSSGVFAEPEALFSVGEATHLTFTLNQELESDLWLGFEGFFKHFGGMPVPHTDRRRSGEPLFTTANSSGVDIWLRRSGPVSGWLGYSLAWVWTDEHNGSSGFEFGGGGGFAGRHLLSGGIEGGVGDRTGYKVQIAYGAGLPYAAIPSARPEIGNSVLEHSSRNILSSPSTDDPPLSVEPEEPYLRVDASVSHSWPTRVWGRQTEIRPYFKVLNALDRRDGFFFRVDPEDHDGDVKPLAPLPIIPLLGLEWRF